MNSINLYELTRYSGDKFGLIESVLSDRVSEKKIKKHEKDTVFSLVNLLMKHGCEIDDLDGFYFSYEIEHIGKEFDLLKIENNNLVLNIELKSQSVDIDKIESQLRRNYHYLRIVATNVQLFTYVMETDDVYWLNDKQILESSNIDCIVDILKEFKEYLENGIEKLFKAREYLISPLNNSEKFLVGEYFLTKQQEEIKSQICKTIEESKGEKIIGIKGEAGTGKTLLLYDLVKYFSQKGTCCVIHCGVTCAGHEYLNKKMSNVSIYAIKNINNKVIEKSDYIFVDEIHRIVLKDYNFLISAIEDNKKQMICAHDYKQALSMQEKNNNIPDKLRGFEKKYVEYCLTNKIRTNKELISFVIKMLDSSKNSNDPFRYENIKVIYAKDYEEVNSLIKYYKTKGFTSIGYTQSMYNTSSIDDYKCDYDTHHVIGQEFDSVLVVMDDNFAYDKDGKLIAKKHPNPNYLFYKLFFQAVSRTREKLCIIVSNNLSLYEKLIQIKSNF